MNGGVGRGGPRLRAASARARAAIPRDGPSADLFALGLRHRHRPDPYGDPERKPREVTVEEALQHRTYQDAIAGNRAAQREVLKMIAKRETWRASKSAEAAAARHRVADRAEDPHNANEVLILLGIAEPRYRLV